MTMHDSGAGIRLSVVMPVYNEEETVADSVRRVRAVPLDLEIICVDDGSRDGTLEQLRVLEAGHSIAVGVVDHAAPGIDTADEYRAFVRRCG